VRHGRKIFVIALKNFRRRKTFVALLKNFRLRNIFPTRQKFFGTTTQMSRFREHHDTDVAI
jgi:hypothetical protein